MSTSLSDEAILTLVREAVSEVAPARAGELDGLTLEVNVRDLQMDSVETMEMIGVIEEELSIVFGDDELAKVVTFGDLAELMRRAVS